MKRLSVVAISLLAVSMACSSSSSDGSHPPSSSGQASSGEGSAHDAAVSAPPDEDAGVSHPEDAAGTAVADATSSGETGTAGGTFWDGGSIATVVMPRISGGVPAFASGGTASNANDDSMSTSWAPPKLPAWIAYDLSKVTSDERQSVLVVWNAPHAGSYIGMPPIASNNELPTDYTIEINAAAGGTSAAPTTGWTQVAAVSKNADNTIETPVALAGGNWVRMSITGSSDPNSVGMDLDVFSTPNGATDAWMFMGDSITYITMGYAFSNLPQLVHQAKPDRWPAVINAAIGGTSTSTAVSVIDSTMAGFPGRYVVLAYGTNDHPAMFEMETLVQKVLAAGKIPVVPHMPWSDTSTIQTNGPMINMAIDALYTKYPQIVHGPDLWAAFLNRTDLIPSGDIHPNAAGQVVLRQQWANVMAAIP
jgi:hypothetical protein